MNFKRLEDSKMQKGNIKVYIESVIHGSELTSIA